jgi:hypothetical protein
MSDAVVSKPYHVCLRLGRVSVESEYITHQVVVKTDEPLQTFPVVRLFPRNAKFSNATPVLNWLS